MARRDISEESPRTISSQGSDEALQQRIQSSVMANSGPVYQAAQAVGGAVSTAANAVASAVNTAADVAGAVIDVARNSVVGQVAAAIATGGASLFVQAGVEGVTGGGPITGAVSSAVKDPLGTLSQIPGVLITDAGLPGMILTGAEALGAAVGIVGGDTSVGQIGRHVQGGISNLQETAREDPMASAAVIAGTVLLATGVGTAAGTSLLSSGLGALAGGTAARVMGIDPNAPPPLEEDITDPSGLSPGTSQQANPDESQIEVQTRPGFFHWVIAEVEDILDIDIPGVGKGK